MAYEVPEARFACRRSPLRAVPATLIPPSGGAARLGTCVSCRQGLSHTDGEFLAKPFTVAALLSRVQESLEDGLKQPHWCPPSLPDLV